MASRTTLIAILEDDPDRTTAMKAALQQHLPEVDALFFDNAPDMIAWLPANLANVCALSLDHDLGPNRQLNGEIFNPGIGRDVVNLLETLPRTCPVIIHSSNGPAADGMFYALQFAGWSAVRVYPIHDLAWILGEWIGRVVPCVNRHPPFEGPPLATV